VKLINGKYGTSLRAACELVFKEAAVGDMSSEVTDLFASFVGSNEIWDQAHRSLRSTVRERYGGSCTWEGNMRLIPVPQLRFDASPVPQLGINVQVYMVWPGEVETRVALHSVTAIGPVGKPEILAIPVLFLRAIMNDDLGRFPIVGRSANHTTWGIPGSKPVKLPDDLTYQLCKILERKSVAMWMDEFGTQGRGVAPLVIGTLLGLESMDVNPSLPTGKQAWDQDTVISALESMAYRPAEAEVMFLRVAPRLRADQTLEDVIRIILRESGKGGEQ
jgi:hypothetical protein